MFDRKHLSYSSIAVCLLSLVGCKTASVDTQQPQSQTLSVSDLEVVDCLLPGQVKRLGTTTFVTQRRPTKTTAADCRIRGGEYVAFDRADYKTALKVWLPSAEAGDAEAQANVGEIYERGLNGEPNYEVAAFWYLKAAKQGDSRAQFNLGTLYEQGLGVPKSKLESLNWYRKAWGMKEDSLVFQSAANQEVNELRTALNKELNKKSRQINLLNKQITQLQAKASSASANAALKEELAELKSWVNKLESEKVEQKQEIDALPKFREPTPLEAEKLFAEQNTNTSDDSKYGKYYALIIGNQDYENLEDLDSPLNDAARAAEILKERYDFNVELLTNVNNLQIMQALNRLNEVLTENDNLLIFYAGHGSRIKNADWESGYWLPINADLPPNDTRWVSNESITRHLSRLKAKRVLVMADSCYAGLLSSAPGFVFAGAKANYSGAYLDFVLPKKSRLLLTSGGDQPVLDNFGKGHSVFARALLDQLANNTKIISGSELFLTIRDSVKVAANAVGVEQTPEFKAIKGAGHEAGSFFFVPRQSAQLSE
ncbi:peptidase C14 [Aliikangiella marina]|uniref:Peptidase C14 n=2 Tax=Aliikangiella marina TaxID=1712262 RepID=A0A545T7J3_9GAMM|nr:peptidase C14 [Aliikangiella marina]